MAVEQGNDAVGDTQNFWGRGTGDGEAVGVTGESPAPDTSGAVAQVRARIVESRTMKGGLAGAMFRGANIVPVERVAYTAMGGLPHVVRWKLAPVVWAVVVLGILLVCMMYLPSMSWMFDESLHNLSLSVFVSTVIIGVVAGLLVRAVRQVFGMFVNAGSDGRSEVYCPEELIDTALRTHRNLMLIDPDMTPVFASSAQATVWHNRQTVLVRAYADALTRLWQPVDDEGVEVARGNEFRAVCGVIDEAMVILWHEMCEAGKK